MLLCLHPITDDYNDVDSFKATPKSPPVVTLSLTLFYCCFLDNFLMTAKRRNIVVFDYVGIISPLFSL